MSYLFRPKRKALILFQPQISVIKSIYRRKNEDGSYNVSIVLLNNIRIIFKSNSIYWLRKFKKGMTVTVYLGNDNYFSMEEGDTVPKDNSIRGAVV